MGAGQIRHGAPVSATVTTDGVAGTSPRVFTFSVDVRPCLVTNTDTGVVVNVKVNASDASATDYHVQLAALGAVDMSLNTRLNVKTVSVYAAGGFDYDNVLVVGWEP